MNILSVGEILWDVVEGDERLGGAPFNFAAQAARLGATVGMVSAVGDDDRGRRALKRARELGVKTNWIRTTSAHPTGHVTVTLEDGQPDYVIHRPAAYDDVGLSEKDIEAIQAFAPDWIYFGTLHHTDRRPRAALERLLGALPRAQRFYDVNLRKESYSAELLADLLPHADVLKINQAEVAEVAGLLGMNEKSFVRDAAEKFGLQAVCVTLAENGSRVWSPEGQLRAPGYTVRVADAVGAGDAYAAAFVHGLSRGWTMSETADFANRVGAVIASKSGATPEWSVEEARALE